MWQPNQHADFQDHEQSILLSLKIAIAFVPPMWSGPEPATCP